MNPQELLSYLPYFPVYLIWLVGGIVALVRWHRHPRVSLVMLIATALFISGMLLNAVGFRWAVNWAVKQGAPGGWTVGEFIYYVSIAASLVHSLFNTATYALLLVAVFGWRGSPRRGDEEDVPEDDGPAPRPGPPGV